MADLSKIKLNGTEYDIKDAVARSSIPGAETDANVENMLDGFDLDYTTSPSTSVNVWQGGNY